jgi:hypothetical protein
MKENEVSSPPSLPPTLEVRISEECEGKFPVEKQTTLLQVLRVIEYAMSEAYDNSRSFRSSETPDHSFK